MPSINIFVAASVGARIREVITAYQPDVQGLLIIGFHISPPGLIRIWVCFPQI